MSDCCECCVLSGRGLWPMLWATVIVPLAREVMFEIWFN
jgi:hypothetical protein